MNNINNEKNNEMARIVDSSFIKDLLKNYLVENDFSEADVNKFLNEIEIDIKSKNANYLTQTKGSYYNFQRNIYLERNAKKIREI